MWNICLCLSHQVGLCESKLVQATGPLAYVSQSQYRSQAQVMSFPTLKQKARFSRKIISPHIKY